MEFGKVPPSALSHIDFTLPPDPAATDAVLLENPVKGTTKFYLGCARLGRREWNGKLYPAKTKDSDFLYEYSRLFNTIEFNSLYYNLPPVRQMEKWAAAVPPGFRFCPKFMQTITHYKRLQQADRETDAFLEAVYALGDKLGPVFLMPHPQMGPGWLPVIERFLSQLPEDIEVFLELRHPAFFEQGIDPQLHRYLKQHRRGLVITDTAGRRDCVHMLLPVPDCFVRFVGNALHPTDYHRIDEWIGRLEAWSRKGLRQCYFFAHQPEDLLAAELLQYLIAALNSKLNSGLTVPELHARPPASQGELFGE